MALENDKKPCRNILEMVKIAKEKWNMPRVRNESMQKSRSSLKTKTERNDWEENKFSFRRLFSLFFLSRFAKGGDGGED